MIKIHRREKKNRFIIRLYMIVFLIIVFSPAICLYILFRTQKLFISPLPKSVHRIEKKIAIYSQSVKELELLLVNKKIHFLSIKEDNNLSAFIILLKNKGEIILSLEKNLEEQVASLQLILTRFTIEGKGVRSLDFRFNKPVIIFL